MMTSTPQILQHRQGSGDPNVATLLTWFIPGAGHLYIGRPIFGLIAFVIVEGLFLLGLKLSDGMGHEFLVPELRGYFAPFLAPEAGNLGALLWQKKVNAFGPGYPRPFPELINVGVMLTALSGVMNICLMAQANTDARLPAPRKAAKEGPGFLLVLTWILPGLGHILGGRKKRGLIIMIVLVGLFVLGTVLAEGSNLSRERHFYYWGGQFLIGLPAVIAEFVHGHAPLEGNIAYGEAGLMIASLAGMLNILTMLDIYGSAERSTFELADRDDAEESEAQEVTA